jgi:hypothetical protein
MIVPLRTAETIPSDSLPVSQSNEMEASMTAGRADCRLQEQPDRKLRNYIILVNVAVWIFIVAAIRFIFF